MKMIKGTLTAILLGCLGCGEPAPFQGAEAVAEAPESAPGADPPGLPGPQASVKGTVAASEQPLEDEDDAETVDEDLTVAKPTDAKLGKSYGGGIITEPLRQHFLIQHRLAFMRLEGAMRDFKVLNDRLPNSHEEYMEKIVKAGAISLPELPTGEEYIYDPKRGELMIRRPQ